MCQRNDFYHTVYYSTYSNFVDSLVDYLDLLKVKWNALIYLGHYLVCVSNIFSDIIGSEEEMSCVFDDN